ncbi:2,3-diaminopropionate biosynthesis protein SbnA [Streptomyces sp. NPDC046862]|uniref:2,3-diaminopropionate biosynthesis protein SbnA n=1 Tax=Streptomyces sp. NPDC046862 TaxID=3154603 RepID=UPI00345556FF
MRYGRPSDLILDDLFLDLPGLVPGIDLALKIEGLNPAGSIKIKTAVALLDDAEQRGLLAPGARIIESSSGNLGIALASVCATRGYAFTCVADPNTPRSSIALMKAFGAQVVVVTRRDTRGGYLQSRIDHIHERLAADPGLLWTNQYANPANPLAHHQRTAAGIAGEFPDLDYLFVGVGTSGTLMGCAEYFRAHAPSTRVVAVDTEGSVTFGHPPGRRHIPGMGTSRRPEILRPGLVDEVVLVPEPEAVAMCRLLAATRGIAVGGSTGSVLAAVAHLGPAMPAGATAVAIGPDTGDRYLDTVYDDDWVRDRFGPSALPFEPHPSPITV